MIFGVPPHVVLDHIEPKYHIVSVISWTCRTPTHNMSSLLRDWLDELYGTIDITYVSTRGEVVTDDISNTISRLRKLIEYSIRYKPLCDRLDAVVVLRKLATRESAMVIYRLLVETLDAPKTRRNIGLYLELVAIRDIFTPTSMAKSAYA